MSKINGASIDSAGSRNHYRKRNFDPLLTQHMNELRNVSREYDGKDFSPVYKYIFSVLFRRYRKKMDIHELMDLISTVTVRILSYWFQKYDASKATYVTYVHRGIWNEVDYYFRLKPNHILKNHIRMTDKVELAFFSYGGDGSIMDRIPQPEPEEPQTDPNELKKMREFILSKLGPKSRLVYRVWSDVENKDMSQSDLAECFHFSKGRAGQYMEKFRKVAMKFHARQKSGKF